MKFFKKTGVDSKQRLYGIKDVTSDRIISVFLADDDIKALRMNSLPTDSRDVVLRRGFNLVSFGEVPTDDVLCRLVDCEATLSEYLDKEGF